MPSIEERVASLEAVVRLMQCDHATQRALHVTTLHDLHTKIDTNFSELDAKFNTLEAKIDNKFAEIDTRFDTMQADISAILTAVGKLLKP